MNTEFLFAPFQAIKNLARPKGQAGTRSPDRSCTQTGVTAELHAAAENLNDETSCTEDCKSSVTTVTWLDDVRDLEDMENRLNEALETKMMTSLGR